MRHSFLVDHYVVVLEITAEGPVIGDPLVGRTTRESNESLKVWRKAGTVIGRT